MERIYRAFAWINGLRGEEVYHFVVVVSMIIGFRGRLNAALASALKVGAPHRAGFLIKETFKDDDSASSFAVTISVIDSNGYDTGRFLTTVESSNVELHNCVTAWLSWRGATFRNSILTQGFTCVWSAPLAKRHDSTFFHLL